MYAAPALRAGPQVVRAAVAQDGRAFKFAAAKLRADKGFVVSVVGQDAFALKFASSELKADKQFVLEVVATNPFALEFAAPELRGDREAPRAQTFFKQNIIAMGVRGEVSGLFSRGLRPCRNTPSARGHRTRRVRSISGPLSSPAPSSAHVCLG